MEILKYICIFLIFTLLRKYLNDQNFFVDVIMKYENNLTNFVKKNLAIYTDNGLWTIQSFHLITEKPVILLLHGTFSSSLMFQDCFEQLKEHFSIVAIDIPGFGMSKAPDTINKLDKLDVLDDYVKVLYLFCKEYNLHDITIVGHSFGAFLSLFFVKKYPELFKQVFFVNMPGLLPTLSEYGFYWSIVFKMRFPQIPIRFLSKIGFYILKFFGASEFILYNYSTAALDGDEGEVLLSKFITFNKLSAYWNYPTILELLRLKIPFSFIWGGSDTITPKEHCGIFKKIGTNLNCHIIKDGPHNPITSNTNEFCEKLIEFYNNPKKIKIKNKKRISSLDFIKNPENYSSRLSTDKTKKIINNVYNLLKN
jgi:pimeloyl-ACP methyl ester carboxylesterase